MVLTTLARLKKNKEIALISDQEALLKKQQEEKRKAEIEQERKKQKEEERKKLEAERLRQEQATLDQQKLEEQKRLEETRTQAPLQTEIKENKSLVSINVEGQDFLIPRNVLEQFKNKGLTEEEQATLTEPEKIARSKELLGQQIGIPELERQIREPLDLTPPLYNQIQEKYKQTEDRIKLKDKLTDKLSISRFLINNEWVKFGFVEVGGSLLNLNLFGLGLGTTEKKLETLNGIVQDYGQGSSVIVENVKKSGDAQTGLRELQKMAKDLTILERKMQELSIREPLVSIKGSLFEYQSNLIETRREILSKMNEVSNILITGQTELSPEVVSYLLEKERQEEEQATLITA